MQPCKKGEIVAFRVIFSLDMSLKAFHVLDYYHVIFNYLEQDLNPFEAKYKSLRVK